MKVKKPYIIRSIMIIFILTILSLSYYFLIYSKINAHKESSLHIDLNGEAYLHTVYLGTTENHSYYAVGTKGESDNHVSLNLQLICTDKDNQLVFQLQVRNGQTFGTQIINDKIYIPVAVNSSDVAVYFYQTYDLDGNLLSSTPSPDAIGNFLPLKGEIYAVHYPNDNNLFYTYLQNINGEEEPFDFGSDYKIEDFCPLADGTAILFGLTGSNGDDGNIVLGSVQAKVCRIDGSSLIWSKQYKERYSTGISPYAVNPSGIIFSTNSGNSSTGLKEQVNIVDVSGNTTVASGISIGLKSWRSDYKFQINTLYSIHGYWDLLLTEYKYMDTSENENSTMKDYILRLNKDGSFRSRKQLTFTDGKDVIGILENENKKRTFLTAKPYETSLDLEIYLER